MQSYKTLILTAAALFSFASFADSGGLYVEPGVTYQSYKSSITYPAPFSNSTGNVNGFGLVARLGFHIDEAFFVAADARYSHPDYKDSTNNLNSSATEYDLGPVVGIQMPVVGLRVWAGYILVSQLDPKGSNNVDYKFTDGTGYRVGAGFHVAMLSLNLEYQKLKYGKTTNHRIVTYLP